MAMNLSAVSATAWAGGPRSATRSMKVARSISRVSSWPSNSANFTPFEAEAVSNMVVLLALDSRTKLVERSHHAAADESIAGWYWSILRDRTRRNLVLSSTAPMHAGPHSARLCEDYARASTGSGFFDTSSQTRR